MPVTYCRCWSDGFGARGWKLDVAIGDPAIIASTRETGDRIPTSVLVHDILDHLLSGFGISGHRAEAMALYQLALRTGSDTRPDYQQLANEDLRYGHVNGESLISFLPDRLLQVITGVETQNEQQTMAVLVERLGYEALTEQLIERLTELGNKGREHATASWQRLGLDINKSSQIGLALQQLLIDADQQAEAESVESMKAVFCIANERCSLDILESNRKDVRRVYWVTAV